MYPVKEGWTPSRKYRALLAVKRAVERRIVGYFPVRALRVLNDALWNETPCDGKHSTSVVYGSTCAACEPIRAASYPQGWAYYPGDTCRHGVYVGGCGADLMCSACESGA